MSDSGGGAPALVIGPLLRYVSDTEATIWVETSRPCEVTILGRRARTFEVAGHHYALVVIEGLRPGTRHEYQVALDGVVRWPEPESEFPPSAVHTLEPGRPLRLAFGSCRTADLPPPRGGQRRQARHEREHGVDALAACALGLPETPRERWPDLLLMIGDQVYADEVGPVTREFIGQRRDPSQPPGYEVADFEEYCFLYREAWSEPAVRWLLSTVPTAMTFDDHDVHDDWNISSSWRRDYQAKPWWPARITAAFMTYWLYQHLGNLSPAELRDDELWRKVRGPGDAAGVLREFAVRADQGAADIRWSFRRTIGNVCVIVIDSRAGRVLANGNRRMVSEAEWQRVTGSVSGDWDHVVLATSLPLLLPRGIHGLEAWSEAVCGGAWGRRAARTGERLRRAFDLEHWAAFGKSFTAFEQFLAGLADGGHGSPPASVTVISGDVHHSYLAEVDLPASARPRSAVYQVVCSPIHNALPHSFRLGQEVVTSRAGTALGTALARLAGVSRPRIGWRITRGPWYDNMLAALDFDGRRARVTFARPDGPGRLQPVSETWLS